MKDPERLKNLILEKVDLADVMVKYGVIFAFNPKVTDRVQYRCPFHGRDNKPSARIYRDTKTCYCWVCLKSWDVISFIQEKEGLGYREALMFIINKYGIDISSIPDEPKISQKKSSSINLTNVYMISAENRIKEMKNKVNLEKYRVLVSFYLTTKFDAHSGKDVSKNLKKLESKMDEMEEALQCK